MGDADDRYLQEIRKDCATVLGPGSEMVAVERQDLEEGVRLVARYIIDGWECESTALGDSILAAHTELRTRLLTDRIRLGFLIVADRA